MSQVEALAAGSVSAIGLVAIGGVNCYSFGARIFAATIYQWSPQIHSRG